MGDHFPPSPSRPAGAGGKGRGFSLEFSEKLKRKFILTSPPPRWGGREGGYLSRKYNEARTWLHFGPGRGVARGTWLLPSCGAVLRFWEAGWGDRSLPPPRPKTPTNRSEAPPRRADCARRRFRGGGGGCPPPFAEGLE